MKKPLKFRGSFMLRGKDILTSPFDAETKQVTALAEARKLKQAKYLFKGRRQRTEGTVIDGKRYTMAALPFIKVRTRNVTKTVNVPTVVPAKLHDEPAPKATRMPFDVSRYTFRDAMGKPIR